MTLTSSIPHAEHPVINLPRTYRAMAAIGAAGLPLILGASFPLAILALWWAASQAGGLPPQILPPPSLVWDSLTDLVADGSLATHTAASLGRVATGFGLAVVVGLSFGTAVALLPAFRAYAWPPVQAVTRVNVLAWMPLLTLFLGIDETLKVVVIAWSAGVPIILGTARGIAGVAPGLRELGAVLRLRPWQTMRLIVIPGALASIFTGLREGLANAWQTLVIVELFASFEGLGYLMTWGRQLFQLDLVLVAMAVISVVGFLLDTVLRVVERALQPWNAEVGS